MVHLENFAEEVSISEEKILIETNNAKITLSNRGGDIVDFELKSLDGDKGVQMADSISEINRAFSLSFGSYDSKIIDDLFQVNKINDYTYGFYKKFRLAKADGSFDTFTLIKQYTFHPDDYLFQLDVIIDGLENSNSAFSELNLNGKAYTLRTSPQIVHIMTKKRIAMKIEPLCRIQKIKEKNSFWEIMQQKSIANPTHGQELRVNILLF